MMKRLSKFLYAGSGIAVCLALTVIMVVYAWRVMGSKSACITNELPDGASLLGLRFGYGYDSVIGLLSSLSDSALACYTSLLKVWDNIFPFIYGSMYSFWLSLLFRNHRFRSERLRLINLYPAVPIIMDLLENFFEHKLVVQYRLLGDVFPAQVALASAITQVKWLASSVNYVLLLTGIILLFVRKLRRKPK